MIEYETTIKVKLDGKVVGEIVEVDMGTPRPGHAYVPKGQKLDKSNVFHTVAAVKRSIEGK